MPPRVRFLGRFANVRRIMPNLVRGSILCEASLDVRLSVLWLRMNIVLLGSFNSQAPVCSDSLHRDEKGKLLKDGKQIGFRSSSTSFHSCHWCEDAIGRCKPLARGRPEITVERVQH